jgi:hypothetical protein
VSSPDPVNPGTNLASKSAKPEHISPDELLECLKLHITCHCSHQVGNTWLNQLLVVLQHLGVGDTMILYCIRWHFEGIPAQCISSGVVLAGDVLDWMRSPPPHAQGEHGQWPCASCTQLPSSCLSCLQLVVVLAALGLVRPVDVVALAGTAHVGVVPQLLAVVAHHAGCQTRRPASAVCSATTTAAVATTAPLGPADHGIEASAGCADTHVRHLGLVLLERLDNGGQLAIHLEVFILHEGVRHFAHEQLRQEQGSTSGCPPLSLCTRYDRLYACAPTIMHHAPVGSPHGMTGIRRPTAPCSVLVKANCNKICNGKKRNKPYTWNPLR